MSDQINPVSAETRTAVPPKSPERPVNAPGVNSQIGENFGGEIEPVSAEARSSQKAPLGGAGEMQDRVCESISPPNRKQRANGMPRELRERICREHAAGVPSPVLAARYGFSHGYIRSIASKAGVSTRTATVKHARRPKFTGEDIQTIARRMRSGESAIAIASDFGLTDEALRSRALRIPVLQAIGFRASRVKTSHRTGYAVGIRRHAPRVVASGPIPTDGVTLMDLKPHACKFPSGSGPIVFCCKARRVAGKPYCPTHQARAYRCEVA